MQVYDDNYAIVLQMSPVHVLQMSPVHVLQMSPVHVLQMSPVHVLQMSPVHVLQMSPVQVLQVQSRFYNMPLIIGIWAGVRLKCGSGTERMRNGTDAERNGVNSISFIWNDNMREKREANANAT